MISYIVMFLVLLPFISGISIYIIKKPIIRDITIYLTTSIVILSSVWLLATGQASYSPPLLMGISWGHIIGALDFIMICFFFYLGVRRKNYLVVGLSLVQLITFSYFELIIKVHHQAKPIFVADWLAIVMVSIISIIGSIIVIYGIPYMRDHEEHFKIRPSRQPRFFMYLVIFLGAMNGLVLSNNLLWLYFFWEVTTLCCFMLISHNGDKLAIKNACKALWMNLIGGITINAAIILFSQNGYGLSIRDLIRGGPYFGFALLPIVLLCLGGLTKSAQMPFQGWLLGAMVAPTPVSALLHSSTMVKAGVYLILRLAPTFQGTALSDMMAFIGSFTFMTAAMLAISQTNGKKVLAYSTISNLGLIITCAGINTPLAIASAMLLLIFHAISKAILFMAIGVVEHRIWSREIESMEGLMEKMPLSTVCILTGILSMILPPFGVIIAKWLSLEAVAKIPLAMVMIVLGSSFTVVFWFKWMGRLLSIHPRARRFRIEILHPLYASPLIILSIVLIILSLFIGPLSIKIIGPAVTEYYRNSGITVSGMEVLSTGFGSVPVLPIFIIIALGFLLPMLFIHIKKYEVRKVYLCGENVDDSRHIDFLSKSDEKQRLYIGSYYFENYFGEKLNNKWINILAILLIVLSFGVIGL